MRAPGMRKCYINNHTREVSEDLTVAKSWYQGGFRVTVVKLDENGKPFHVWEMIG